MSSKRRQGGRAKRRTPVDSLSAAPVKGSRALKVDAAEQEGIGGSAFEDARWMLEQARDDADRLTGDLAALQRRIDAAARLLSGEALGASTEAPEPAERFQGLDVDSGPQRKRRFDRADEVDGDGLRGAHLVAVQMALAGHGREQAAERLSSSLEPSELEALLDDVFGRSRAAN